MSITTAYPHPGANAYGYEGWSSGYTLGLTRWQIFVFALLPQVIRITLPPLTSQFIEVIQNPAVVKFVGVQELPLATQEISQMTLPSFEAATVATRRPSRSRAASALVAGR